MCTSLQFYSTLVTCQGGVLIKTSHSPSFEYANRKVITTPFIEIEAVSDLCAETTLGDKLLKSELIPTKH